MRYDRVYNFSAGPAVLPEPVLQEAAAEMLAGHTASVQTVTFSADGKNEDAAVAACGGSMELLLEIIPEGGSIE